MGSLDNISENFQKDDESKQKKKSEEASRNSNNGGKQWTLRKINKSIDIEELEHGTEFLIHDRVIIIFHIQNFYITKMKLSTLFVIFLFLT